MTKKDFEFIAAVIAGMPDHAATLRAQKDSCARAFAEALAKENPKFNARLFLKACNP